MASANYNTLHNTNWSSISDLENIKSSMTEDMQWDLDALIDANVKPEVSPFLLVTAHRYFGTVLQCANTPIATKHAGRCRKNQFCYKCARQSNERRALAFPYLDYKDYLATCLSNKNPITGKGLPLNAPLYCNIFNRVARRGKRWCKETGNTMVGNFELSLCTLYPVITANPHGHIITDSLRDEAQPDFSFMGKSFNIKSQYITPTKEDYDKVLAYGCKPITTSILVAYNKAVKAYPDKLFTINKNLAKFIEFLGALKVEGFIKHQFHYGF